MSNLIGSAPGNSNTDPVGNAVPAKLARCWARESDTVVDTAVPASHQRRSLRIIGIVSVTTCPVPDRAADS